MSRASDNDLHPERRAELPEQSTSQILWLVAAVITAGLPHYPFVAPWVPAMVIGIALVRTFIAIRRWKLPATWIRAPLTLAAFFGVFATYRQISGLDAGSALLLIMVSMKLLETRGERDRAVVVFICFFLLFSAFLREQALWSAAYLMAGVLVTTACLYQIARRGSVMPTGQAMRMSISLIAQATPLMLLLFILFPRISGPFWALPTGSGASVTGLSDSMTPGDITSLARSDQVAFRVRFERPPVPAQLYWRGPVMNDFDGRTWHRSRYRPVPRPVVPDDAELLAYEITMEATDGQWLLALESPVEWDYPQAMLTSARQLVSVFPIERRIAYQARSAVSPAAPRSESARVIARALALPADANPRSAAFARRERAAVASDREFLQALLRFFAEQPFWYTLEPPPLSTEPVDAFLFDTRRGFCGHFASAFVVLARAAGIPARVVTGYQGAERNPLGNYWMVRQSNAHAWAEAWLDGRWARFDPTAAVAPERITSGLDDAIADGNNQRAGRLAASAWLDRLALGWDAANTAWNRWVLAYGPDAQAALMAAAGIVNPSRLYLLSAMLIAVTVTLTGLVLAHQWRAVARPDPLQRAYARLCAKTARIARPRHPAEGPSEYSHAAAAMRPDLASQLRELFGRYANLRYERAAEPRAQREFRTAVNAFRPPRRPAKRGPAADG